MTSEPVRVWDDNTVEKVAVAIHAADRWPSAWQGPEMGDSFTRDKYITLARAALSVIPDPTGDAALLAKVRALVLATRADVAVKPGQDAWRIIHEASGFTAIAALLAGGAE